MRTVITKFLICIPLFYYSFSLARDTKFISLEDVLQKSNANNIKPHIKASASHNMAASCYRCGLARTDIISEDECVFLGYKWDLKTIKELRRSCDTNQ